MRIHLRRDVVAVCRLLNQYDRADLLAKLELLKRDQAPDWTIEVAGKPGTREFFVGGYWFGYTVDYTGG